jgi:hypothetical protein
MKSAAALPLAARALLTYPLDGLLAEIAQPIVLGAAPWDPNKTHTQAAAEKFGFPCPELPIDESDWAGGIAGTACAQ